MTDETIQDRVERAESENMEVSLVDMDPLVVQVYNEASDRIHTVIPASVHCSCEDSTYRDTICKHLITLLQSEGHVGDTARESLKQRRNSLGGEITEKTEQLNELRSERDAIVDALGAVGASQVAESTVEDVLDGFQVEAEAVNSAETDSPFEQMVDDLAQGGNNE